MSYIASITDGITTVRLNEGGAIMGDYVPAGAEDSALTVVESFTVSFTSEAAGIRRRDALMRLFAKARRDRLGDYSGVEMALQKTAETERYSSPILDGRVEPAPETLTTLHAQCAYAFTVYITRPNFWEGAERRPTMGLWNGSSWSYATGVLTVPNFGTFAVPAIYNNQSNILGALPAPVRMRVQPSAAWNLGGIHVGGVQRAGFDATTKRVFEAETDFTVSLNPGTVKNAVTEGLKDVSNGNFYEQTLSSAGGPTTQWFAISGGLGGVLINTSDGAMFKPILRLAQRVNNSLSFDPLTYVPATVARIRYTVDGFTSDWVEIKDFDRTVELPALRLRRDAVSGVMMPGAFTVQWQRVQGTSVLMKTDALIMLGLDTYTYVSSVTRAVTGAGNWLVDDAALNAVYEETSTVTSGKRAHPVRSTTKGLQLVPNVDNAFGIVSHALEPYSVTVPVEVQSPSVVVEFYYKPRWRTP